MIMNNKFSRIDSAQFSAQLRQKQTGVVLLVALLFLVVLTLLGIGASRLVTSEERMSRYLREYNSAFQAAESAMRDARDDIDGLLSTGVKKNQPRIEGAKGFFDDCKYGLCLYDKTETARPWTNAAMWANATPYGTYSLRSPLPKSGVVGANAGGGKDENETGTARYSDPTSGSLVTGVWQQPSYLIEAIIDNRPGTNTVEFGKQNVPVVYRITARGFGADPNSTAMVQEIYTSPIASPGS